MRSRSNSGVRLDYFQRVVHRTILKHQNAVSGLLSSTTINDHSWIRDNCYSILAVWGLSMAYKKNADLDEDRAKTYELEQSCVKLMRGLLMAMMKQREKVERFKETQAPLDSLHAKYSSKTGGTVVGDHEWGHLQLDAISFYLLLLAQMTASGLQIIFTLDEVAFIQNLVFYIESSYCIPDYGIWERGDKTNHGLPELNASSIGMAKAALEALNELDLFGARGGQASVIHVLADEAQKCHAMLESMLPRESNSKEVDAALLSIISFPAFAVEDPELIKLTRDTIIEKLRGHYGCKRFLRDGYKTAKEDPNRLYYEPWELKVFEDIECEWPLFFCYLIIDACFTKDRDALNEYADALDKILVKTDDGFKYVPELYAVSADKVENEYRTPHSQPREPIGQIPFMWAQSLYILGRLLQEGFLAPGELDPLNRRLSSESKPDVVVQVVILAEDISVQEKLRSYDINVQTVAEVAPIEVYPARVLSHIFSYLGKNKKLGLSGRQSRDVGLLSTSKLYRLQNRILAFTPQNLDREDFFIVNDIDLLANIKCSDLAFLRTNWHMLGRPTMTTVVFRHNVGLASSADDQDKIPTAMISTIKKVKDGYINGTRVTLGTLQDFLSTSCLTDLSFLGNIEAGLPESLNSEIKDYLLKQFQKPRIFPTTPRISVTKPQTLDSRTRRSGISGIIRRTRSIQVDKYDPEICKLRANYQNTQCTSAPGTPGFDAVDSKFLPPTEEDIFDEDSPPHTRLRVNSGKQFDSVTEDELVIMLRDSESLDEQGDILHYLVVTKGLNWKIGFEDDENISVKDALKNVYEKACHEKKWSLVRHIAGMLGKRVEGLTKAVADLLVRQKQVTIGMPPFYEFTITRPLPTKELRSAIDKAHGGDQSTAMLTQELIVYLAMFIRTEPQLFREMLRLRVGLIIQVMASELARSLKCSGDDASEHLLNLSPFEMKTLLQYLLSGKEFQVKSVRSGVMSVSHVQSSKKSMGENILGTESPEEDTPEDEKQGQWLRRRRLDGALNRVPQGFYPQLWSVIERCQCLSIEGKMLSQQLTREMTPGELKFALQVEQVLNSIPQPEYRQLMVEALIILTAIVENGAVENLGGVINIENLVKTANQIFLEDQKKEKGIARKCCIPSSTSVPCNGAAGICQYFYDSAPSGNHGTMTYMVRAVASSLNCFPPQDLDCSIS